MGLVRVLLPVPRAVARLAPGVGRPLLGAALSWCVMPRWVLLRPPPVARRAAWAEELVALYRPLADPDRLARALVLRAHGLLLAGRYDEACAAADGSLAVPGARPSATQSAFALHTRAQALLFGGRPEEALEAARETVESYRRAPAPARRDRGLRNLPGALRTHALVLGALGRTAESVTVYEECAALRRSMSVRESARDGLNHPRVFAELVRGLRVLGRYEEALAAGPEAREAVRGAILWTAPEIVLTLRVQLLTDLAACESAVGRSADGRETAEEAVAEARRLTGRDPAVGESQLAAALDRLITVLDELKAYDDELTALRELADVYSRHADAPRLADTLDDIARCLGLTGDHRAALREGERAVTVVRRSADRDPGRHEPQLAWLLANLSLRQHNADAAESAVATAREAVTLTRRLAEGDWTTYQPLTARRLRVLGQALRGTGEFTEAVACYEEAEAALRELIDDGGDHTAELALTHSRLATTLHLAAHAQLDAGRTAEAVTALRSLLALTRRADAPDVHARCVRTFAEIRAERGDDVTRAWQRATGEPYPTFRYTRVRGRGSNPAAR
jgi:tetratricopeptide (TPR) repeat protein